MTNRYRLRSSAFERPQGDLDAEPRRAFVLSLEGTRTEPDYFRGLNEAINKGRMDISNCIIVPLEKRDTNSDPKSVIALLEEYINLRETDVCERLPSDFLEKYSRREIRDFLDSAPGLSKARRREIEEDLLLLGFDLPYQYYLSKFDGPNDVFAIVIDHDKRPNLRKHIEYCQEKGYNVFLSNPCFEFWLLLHLTDVKQKYKEADLLENERVSKRHTFLSREVSRLCGSANTVDFEGKYLTGVEYAIQQAKLFETNIYGLLENLGTNLGVFFEMLRNRKENMWE